MIQHTLIALALQAVIYLATGNVLASALPFLVFIGREQAQSEYRYMSKHNAKRSDVNWLVVKSLTAWDLKSSLDWVVPMIANIIIGVILHERLFSTL